MSSERSPLLRTTTQGSPNNGNRNNAGSVEVRTDVPSQEMSADTNVNTIKDNESNPAAQYYLRSKWRKSALFVVLLLVNVLGPLSTETQVPALQQIADDLDTSSTWVQMSITIYMLCFGAFQLVFGTLSDIYGRRNVLLVGLVIYCGTNIGKKTKIFTHNTNNMYCFPTLFLCVYMCLVCLCVCFFHCIFCV